MLICQEVRVSNNRRLNRDAFVRVFQCLVDDFGKEPAEKIVNQLVHRVGGLRISVPENNGDPLFGCSQSFRLLWFHICAEFGQASGRAIMRKLIVELGGSRVTFPDIQDLSRFARDEKIRNQFTGDNCQELSIRWGLHPVHIKRIVRRDD